MWDHQACRWPCLAVGWQGAAPGAPPVTEMGTTDPLALANWQIQDCHGSVIFLMSVFHIIISCSALAVKELMLQFYGLWILLGSWLDKAVFPKVSWHMFIWLNQITPCLPAPGSTLKIYSPFPHTGAISPFFPLH